MDTLSRSNQAKLPKRLSVILALAIGIFAFSFAITWGVIKGIQTARNTITIGIVGHPTRINPLLTTGSTVDMMLISLLYEPLFEFNQEHRPIGVLAESWDIDDAGTTYTITLKDGLTWSDGIPVTSQDVVFSYLLTQKENYTGREKNRFSGVTITPINDRTIEFTLEEVFAPFLESLTLRVIPKHIWGTLTIEEMRQSPQNLEPIGSSDFIISNITIEDETVTSIEISSRSQHTNVARIIFYESLHDLNLAYSLGEIDTFITQTPSVQEYYRTWENTLLAESPICGQSISLYVNTEFKARMPDYDRFINALYASLNMESQVNTISYSSLQSTHWAYTPNTPVEMNTDDIKTAFVDTISAEEPLNIVLVVNDDIKLYVESLMTNLKDLSLPMNITTVDATFARSNIMPERNFDILIIPQQLTHDPDVYAFWHSSQVDLANGELNISGYKNRQMDKALEDGRTTLDLDARKSAYETVQQKLYDEKLAIFMNHPPIIEVTRVNSPSLPIKECLWYTSDYLEAKFSH